MRFYFLTPGILQGIIFSLSFPWAFASSFSASRLLNHHPFGSISLMCFFFCEEYLHSPFYYLASLFGLSLASSPLPFFPPHPSPSHPLWVYSFDFFFLGRRNLYFPFYMLPRLLALLIFTSFYLLGSSLFRCTPCAPSYLAPLPS